MRPHIPIVILTAALTAAGCAATPTGSPDSPMPVVTAAQPSEGPASQEHGWPDGLTARIVSLQRLDPKLGGSLQTGQTLVKLTLTLSNPGSQAVPLPPGRVLWHLLDGLSWFEASNDEGDQYSGPLLTSAVPGRVAPGQTVTVFDSWHVPDTQLGVLAVRVDLAGTREPWVFTDAQTLLDR
jgi:hypothetical protein